MGNMFMGLPACTRWLKGGFRQRLGEPLSTSAILREPRRWTRWQCRPRSSMDYVSLNSGRGLSLINTIKWSTRGPSAAKGRSKRAYEYGVFFSM